MPEDLRIIINKKNSTLFNTKTSKVNLVNRRCSEVKCVCQRITASNPNIGNLLLQVISEFNSGMRAGFRILVNRNTSTSEIDSRIHEDLRSSDTQENFNVV